MQVRLNKKNAEYIEYIMKTGLTVNEAIEDLIKNSESKRDLSDEYLLNQINDNVLFIVNSIKAKSEKQKIEISPAQTIEQPKRGFTMSDKQEAYYNDKFNTYKKNFEENKSRGTDSKFIDDLYVFEPGNNKLNDLLRTELGLFILEKDIDRTEYLKPL